MNSLRHYRYKNLTFLIISFIVAFLVFRLEIVHEFLLHIGNFGYLGAFIGGMLFVSTFTIATGAVLLLVLAEKLSPLEIGIIAGLGAVIGDLTIFRFIKDNLIREVTPLYNNLGGRHFTTLLHTKYFSWTLPVLGAIIIASPLPDELGITLMGIAKMKTYQFVAISFILNVIGIFLIISASSFIKP